jgi:serine protease
VTGIHSFDTNGQGPGILDPTDPAGYAKVGVVPIVESGFGSLNYSQWGPMTGTSMATPMVTGTVGLMRSINPMVSVASVRALLKSSAMDTITEHQFNLPPPAEPPQYKRLNMENAVKSTLASVRGIQQVNRLIPMFSMRATQSQQFIRDTKGNGESASWEKDDPFETSAIDSWLFTTSTQVATAGLTGDLAYTGFQDINDDFGTDQRTQFKAGATYGTGGALPSYRFTQWGAASSSDQLPTASFYLFSTETKPAGLPATAQLIPLWRLSTRCFEIRKYSYSTNAAERNSFTSTGTDIGDTVATCIPNSTRKFWEEGIEGYVLSEQAPGTVPLYRVAKFTGATSTVALSTKSPDDNAAFSGLSDFAGPANNAILGYVYPTEVAVGSSPRTLLDSDGDGLENQFERVTGLNEQTANSDCDGSDDGVEFPIAGISPSDPMDAGSCADLRLTKQGDDFLVSNPVGPAVAQNVIVRFEYLVQTIPSNPAAALPITPSGWSCGFVAAPPNSPMDLQVYECTIPSVAVSLNALFDLSPGSSPLLVAPGAVTVSSSTNDPVPGNNDFP